MSNRLRFVGIETSDFVSKQQWTGDLTVSIKLKIFHAFRQEWSDSRHLSKLITSHITDGQAIRFKPSKWILLLKAGLRRVESTSTNSEYVGNFFSVFQRWGPQCSFPAEVILLFQVLHKKLLNPSSASTSQFTYNRAMAVSEGDVTICCGR